MSFKKNIVVTEQIGSGSMATVSRAIQKSLDRIVVVKQIHPHLSSDPLYVSRFEREAKAASSLKHLNIMDVIDFGIEDSQYFLIAEYIDGPSLLHLLNSSDKLPLPVILCVGTQILSGLEHAHNKGVIHRDIKPDNIMFTSSGVAKITDFGVARAADLPSLTQAGHRAIGTPSYMSPEQAQGKTVDQRADLFSVGVILYQMLTNTLPFTGDSIAVTLKKLIYEPHPPVKEMNPDVPDDLVRIVERALSKDITQRFFDATEFMVALEIFAFEADIVNEPEEIRNFITRTPDLKEKVVKDGKFSTSQIRQMRQTTGAGADPLTAAILPLTGCFGCQVNLFDLHEDFKKFHEIIDIQFSYFMDIKEIPQVNVGIVEGCVGNSEDEKRLKVLRERCETLVALGTCACFGGIPGLRNLHPLNDVLSRAYIQSESTAKVGHIVPGSPAVPSMQAYVRPVSDVVKADFTIPGCPSPRKLVLNFFEHMVKGNNLEFSTHTLCFECKRTRKEMLNGKQEFIADDIHPIMELERIDPDICFLEQGVLCMGLTTRAGCEARCIRNNIPCQGCMGPAPQVKETGTKLINTLGSLLPGGTIRFRHDLVGLGYCYTLPVSMMPFKKS